MGKATLRENEQREIFEFLFKIEARKITPTTYLQDLKPVYQILEEHNYNVHNRLEEIINVDVMPDASKPYESHDSRSARERALLDTSRMLRIFLGLKPEERLKPLYDLAELAWKKEGKVLRTEANGLMAECGMLAQDVLVKYAAGLPNNQINIQ